MAKRRTRKDKIIAQLRRQIIPPSLSGDDPSFSYSNSIQEKSEVSVASQVTTEGKDDLVSLFSYDPILIRNDLIKTVLLSLCAFGVLFILYFTLF